MIIELFILAFFLCAYVQNVVLLNRSFWIIRIPFQKGVSSNDRIMKEALYKTLGEHSLCTDSRGILERGLVELNSKSFILFKYSLCNRGEKLVRLHQHFILQEII